MRDWQRRWTGARKAWIQGAAALPLLVSLALPLAAGADPRGSFPLRPPDTSSPRDTLESFLSSLDEAYAAWKAGHTEFTADPVRRARRCLDLSEVPIGRRWNVESETVLLLREVFDRVGAPALAEVPGDDEVAATSLTKWTVPDTEITIERVREGPREGEFLFSPETIARAKEFYERSRYLPYRPEAARDIDLYQAYILTPGRGLDPGWTRVFPGWAGTSLLEQALWQWAGLVLVLFIGASAIVAAFRWGRRLDRRRSGATFKAGRIGAVLFATFVVLLADQLIDAYINITGVVLEITQNGLILATYALLGWLAALVINRIPEAIIRSRRLLVRGVDSQLLRLAFRLLTFVILTWLIVEGAAQVGLPAYSVITGLGVGGIAFALAARDTLANFLGSIILMWDRPYRVGDWIIVGDKEGTVEDIGFRSTRIRTFYDSQLSIPNSDTVNATVDNMGRRKYRRVRTYVSITYDTPTAKIEAFLEGIKNIIRANPATRKDYFNVVLHDLGDHSLQILLYFFVRVADWPSELVERQRVLLEVLRLAEAMEIRLAFPTQTVQVERFPGQEPPESSQPPADEQLRAIARDFGPEGERARPRGLGLFEPNDAK